MSIPRRPTRRTLLALAGLGAGAALLSACGEDTGGSGTGGLTVVTTNYPLHYLVQRVGGERVDPVDLATPGADGHGLELSMREALTVQEAALVLQIPGYQAAVDDAIASGSGGNVLDISQAIALLPADGHSHEEESASDGGGEHAEGEHHADEHADEHADDEHAEGEDHAGHDHGPDDPHFWHDPLRMADVADALADRLTELDPEGADAFAAGAEAVRAELEELDRELAAGFAAVAGERAFITSHAAFGYLADRYDLHQIGITGVDPETEPSPRRLLELEKLVKDEGVSTIFFESTASPKVAQTLATNVGISSEELDNLETRLSEDADYAQVMRENSSKLLESWA